MWGLLGLAVAGANLILFGWVLWRASNILFDPRPMPGRMRGRAMMRVALVALPVWMILLACYLCRAMSRDVDLIWDLPAWLGQDGGFDLER